jgi:hypothetical protein
MKDKDIVKEAHDRFKSLEEAEAANRALWVSDLKFSNADSDNGWQWDDDMQDSRDREGRPCITVNKVKQHNRQIINEGRQNKPRIVVKPVDDGADKETAEVINGIIRHIEENSSADTAYNIASEFAVDAGLGYWRVITDYESDDGFNQEIYIKAVRNPLNVYMDEGSDFDGSDSAYAFVFEDMNKSEFIAKYPDAKYKTDAWGPDIDNSWKTEETIRIAEYIRIVESKETITNEQTGQKRTKVNKTVKWSMIAGDEIIEEKEWLGKYIPIVRVVGDEKVIDGKVWRTGHTRQMKDAQRMYNYNLSSNTEFVALQSKIPWDGPAEAFEKYKDFWETANTDNHAYLPWNHKDENGDPIPRPQRVAPPVSSQAYLEGMKVASEDMQMASGQYDGQLGRNVNDQSGIALNKVQQKGETATFHFVDNRARALKFTGKILVDLIPKIYDTARVARIIGEDNEKKNVQLDPEQQQPLTKQLNPVTGEITEIYNLGIGRYDVTVDVGADYGTKRQEAFQALSEIASRNPALMQVAGDIIMQAADFPMADKLAERLKKTLPPELQDKPEGQQEIPPDIQQHLQQADQQLQQAQAQIQQLDTVIQKMSADVESKDEAKMKAFTDEQTARSNRLKIEAEARLADAKTQEIIKASQLTEVDMQKEQQQMMLMQQMAQVMEQFSHVGESVNKLHDAMAQVHHAATLPRKSELQFDENGMPVSSISYPVTTQ